MAHPDAFNAWSLLEYAHTCQRCEELLATNAECWKAVKGLGTAQAGLFNLPSSQLFLDFCDKLLARLAHTFIRASAVAVRGEDGAFEVELSDRSTIIAGVVVLALGVPGPASVPPAFEHLPRRIAFHTDETQRLRELRKGDRVLVVGGGLTAVQAALLAEGRGCRVSLCSRRELITRHFDIPVEWFDPRIQGRLRHSFWEQPFEERLRHLRATKGGGSVPLVYMERLKAAEAAGRVRRSCGQAEVGAAEDGKVSVQVAGQWRFFDRVILACGHRPAYKTLPLLRELQAKWPVEEVGGLPRLSKDLQWGETKQLFVVGALAALQVGPDAANLMGCRRAAQVVAQSMGLRLWQRTSKPSDGSISVNGNRYAVLSDSDDDPDTDTGSTSE